MHEFEEGSHQVNAASPKDSPTPSTRHVPRKAEQACVPSVTWLKSPLGLQCLWYWLFFLQLINCQGGSPEIGVHRTLQKAYYYVKPKVSTHQRLNSIKLYHNWKDSTHSISKAKKKTKTKTRRWWGRGGGRGTEGRKKGGKERNNLAQYRQRATSIYLGHLCQLNLRITQRCPLDLPGSFSSHEIWPGSIVMILSDTYISIFDYN